MPRPDPTEIRINEQGDEGHESWLLIRASHVSGSTRLFDSEITHQHYISVSVSRCTRQRDLNRDWLFAREELIEIDMSEAQWGGFVSSFGNGSGVPATLNRLLGKAVPRVATVDSRLDKSHQEVKGAATKAMEDVKKAHVAVQEAFEQKLGVKEMRARLQTLQYKIDQFPDNIEFVAKSLSEHVEAVVTKSRADIEAMATNAQHYAISIEAPMSLVEIEQVDGS